VAKVLATLNDLHPRPDTPPPRSALAQAASLGSTRLLIASGGLLGALALLGGLHFLSPLPRAVVMGAVGLGIAVQGIALLAMLLHIVSDLGTLLGQHRRRGESSQDEAMHDHDMAARLLVHPVKALEATDRWLAQKTHRLERRQTRFFGGPDKLALVALMAAGWTAWKDVGADVLSWQPSPLLFGVALLVGLALGGMAVLRRVDQLAYQRDLLQIAKALATVLKVEEEEEAFSLGPFLGTSEVVVCNDTPVLQ
jgi:hypothetical protein